MELLIIALLVAILAAVVLAGIVAALLARRPAPPTEPPAPAHPPRPSTPPPPTPSLWLPPNQPAKIATFTLPGGMIYVGSSLPAATPHRGQEPSLIDPRLPVASVPDHRGEGMGYWPSYASISPAHRAGYLAWLSAGRWDPSAYIGYVFLFFYGLERRVLHDMGSVPGAEQDAPAILAEVERLLRVYGANGSFSNYAGRFLPICRLRAGAARAAPAEADLPLFGWELPLEVRIALGEKAKAHEPLAADLAFAWVCNGQAAPRRTPVTRCPTEFRELFRLRYQAVHGSGVLLPNRGRQLRYEYRPASASFGGQVELKFADLRDVAEAPILSDLQALAARCVEDLDPYSRWLGRNTDAAAPTLTGLALLPQELLARHAAPALAEIRAWLARTVTTAEPTKVPTRELLSRWGSDAEGKLSKGDAVALAQFLAKLGVGLEPDARFLAATPAASGQVVLFRLPEGAPASPSPEYAAAWAVLRLAACVAGADGVVESEARFLSQHVEAVAGLSAAEKVRLGAYLAHVLDEPPGVAGVKKLAEGLDPGKRDEVGQFLVAVTGADGQVSRQEIAVLTKLYPLLGFAPEAVYQHIHALRPAGEEPVVVRPAAPRKDGFTIPIPPRAPAKPVAEGFALDMARVQARLAESAAISAVLADVFKGDEEPARAPTRADPAVPPVQGLDPAHSALVRQLAGATEVPRGVWVGLCRERGLLPDGALDVLNEAAIEAVGDPLLAGEDPLEIDPTVYKELLA